MKKHISWRQNYSCFDLKVQNFVKCFTPSPAETPKSQLINPAANNSTLEIFLAKFRLSMLCVRLPRDQQNSKPDFDHSLSFIRNPPHRCRTTAGRKKHSDLTQSVMVVLVSLINVTLDPKLGESTN